MTSRNSLGVRLLAVVFVLLLTVFKNAEAAVTESVGFEDDEDSIYVGSFSVQFQVNVSCSTGNWFNENNGPFSNRLQNSIADDIRIDCAECPFENHYLERVRVSCNEQRVSFLAVIENWISPDYPVPYILKRIELRYNGSGESVVIVTGNFTAAEFLPGNIVLEPMNVSVQYSTVSSGSGEGPPSISSRSSSFTDEQVISTDIEDSTDDVKIPEYNTTLKAIDLAGPPISGSLPCTSRSGTIILLVLSALLSSISISLLH